MIIKRIDPMSVAKITGIIAAVFGLIAGIIFFLFGSMLGLSGGQGSGLGMAMAGGFMSIILLPIMYGIFGFIGGLIQAWVYNIAAGYVGGVRIDTE